MAKADYLIDVHRRDDRHAEAERIGLVAEMGPHEQLMDRVRAVVIEEGRTTSFGS